MSSPVRKLTNILIALVVIVTATGLVAPLSRTSTKQEVVGGEISPSMSFFSSLPVHLVGERVETTGYAITLKVVAVQTNVLRMSVIVENNSGHEIDLGAAVKLHDPTGQAVVLTNPYSPSERMLPDGQNFQGTWRYQLTGTFDPESLTDWRLLYAPFGWSGPVILYRLADTAPVARVTPRHQSEPLAYGATGDPWKMLILIYKNIDTLYTEGGVQKRLTATMPAADIENMKNDFLNLPHQSVVNTYSNGTAELEAHVVVVDRALTDLEPIADGFWPSPDVTRQELDLYAPKGKYDSVIVFWQASHPTTGQSLPVYGWGLGYWPGDYANGMTYATVFNISWVWPSDACQGEVFLHEWLHGVTGFYAWRGFAFPFEDLHGAEEAGYVTDANGCWKDWLKDYMRGLVYENGKRTALVTQTWHGGSITTYDIQGWRGEYFNNETLYGTPMVIRDDPAINFFWELGSPHPLVNVDHFSARWTKTMQFKEGHYRFAVTRDDGIRVWVDDQLILDSWYWGYVNESVDYYLTGGAHTVRVETYEIDGWASARLTITPLSRSFTSVASQDGYILETAETGNSGGTANSSATTFRLGDDAARKQYRSILSFNTGPTLPDNAVITKVTLKVKRQAIVGGGNPVTAFQGFVLDMRRGTFGTSANLQVADWQANANKAFGPFPPALTGGWYTFNLTSAKAYINKLATGSGLTQIRLRFKLDDNNNAIANYLSLYSGNAGAASRPQLIIEYYIP